MDDTLDLAVSETDAGMRLDRFLALRAGRGGRAQVSAWLDHGRVTVDGRRLRKGDRVLGGQRVRVAAAASTANEPQDAPTRPLSIVFEDAHVVVVDKPAGIPSHALHPNDRHALAEQLAQRFPEMREVGYRPAEPGILHRLDNDTSGLLIAARTREAFDALRAQLQAGAIQKQYLALCVGHVLAPQVFDGFLVSDRSARVKVSPTPDKRSRPARTEVIAAQTFGPYTLTTLAAPQAGRHQIRAHLTAAGHPLVGDRLYGGPDVSDLHRHFLHASQLRFQHPITQQAITLSSPLPPELMGLLDRL